MKTIHFLKFGMLATVLSIVGICVLWGLTFYRGVFNIGVDFKSGLSMTVLFPNETPNLSKLKESLDSLHGVQVQKGENNQVIIRAVDTGEQNFQESTEKTITDILTQHYAGAEVLASDFVGAGYSSSMVRNSVLLVLGALAMILAYLWLRFELSYALSVILSTVHDVFFLIGFIGAFQLEINAATVAAVLTIIGYSLNDTIVTFDRIRENRYTEKRLSMHEIIDLSITQTLSRTIITSLTTLLSIIAIVFLATGSVRLFAIEMVFGIIIGTYSSIFIAGASLNSFFNHQMKKASKAGKNTKLAKA